MPYGIGTRSDSPMLWEENGFQVNDLLVESIKAKLEVLGNL
jgi:hypothetical protein